MGATFSRIKNWTTEVLSNSDLNAEIDNILTNLGPSGIDDLSTNSTEMRTQTNPGAVGSESLATSLAGEIERLRYAIARITGETYWYTAPASSLTDLVASVGGGFSSNRISSGAASSLSSQLRAIIPSGTTTSMTINGSTTTLSYYINDVAYSISTDLTVTGLSAAPSSNATASIADSQAGDAQYTEFLGEFGTTINISAAGSEFASRVGQYAGFALNNGAATEYFLGYISSTTAITRAMRGCFINSSSAVVPRLRFTAGDSVTLLRTGWIFANSSSSISVTYTTPVFSATEPSAPSTGDYWFDFANDTWKTYNSVSWIAANATLIGMTLQTSAACVAARTFDKFTAISDSNSIELEWVSNAIVQANSAFASINVFGTDIKFGVRPLQWDMTSHLESGLTETASTYYYFYVTESGAPMISDKVPLDLRGSRGGLYHPQETWRCVGCAFNNGSSNLDLSTVYSFSPKVHTNTYDAYHENNSYRLEFTTASQSIVFTLKDRIGNYPSDLIPTHVTFRNPTITNGGIVAKAIRNALSVTIPTNATLGHGTASNCYTFLYAVDGASSISMALSSTTYSDRKNQTVSAISTSATTSAVYGNSNETAVALAFLGHAKWNTGVNGFWGTPSRLVVGGNCEFDADDYVQNQYGAHAITSASFVFNQVTASANGLYLSPGDWELTGAIQWVANGNNFDSMVCGWTGAPGANTSATPTLVSALAGANIYYGKEYGTQFPTTKVQGVLFNEFNNRALTTGLRLAQCQTIYLVSGQTAPGTGVIHYGYCAARRILGVTY